MASHAGIRRTPVIHSVMTGSACEGRMSPLQHVIVVVNRECCRFPPRCGSMAVVTVRRDPKTDMVRVGGLVVVCLVASHAGIRGIHVIAVMTCNTSYGGMGSGQCIVIAMYGESCRFPTRCCGMAGGTGIRNVFGRVIRIRCTIVISLMAGRTFGGGTMESIGMALIAGSGQMSPGEREPSVIMVECSGNGSGGMTFITI